MTESMPNLSTTESMVEWLSTRFECTRFAPVFTVAANIFQNHGSENALTYLLGAMDTLSVVDPDSVSAIRSVREEIKKHTRK